MALELLAYSRDFPRRQQRRGDPPLHLAQAKKLHGARPLVLWMAQD